MKQWRLQLSGLGNAHHAVAIDTQHSDSLWIVIFHLHVPSNFHNYKTYNMFDDAHIIAVPQLRENTESWETATLFCTCVVMGWNWKLHIHCRCDSDREMMNQSSQTGEDLKAVSQTRTYERGYDWTYERTYERLTINLKYRFTKKSISLVSRSQLRVNFATLLWPPQLCAWAQWSHRVQSGRKMDWPHVPSDGN